VLWRDLPAGAGPVAVEGEAVAGWVARHAATPTVRALVRALRPRALLVAPLMPGTPPAGAPAAPPPGALTLFALHGGAAGGGAGAGAPAFDAADRALAAALAERVALAAVAARLYADARRAVRARDEVLAVVAHDLRTPLGAVATLARAVHDGVRDGTVSRAEQLGGLATIREAAGLGDRLIRDLLDAALIDAGRLRVDRRPVAPATVVAGALALFTGAVTARGITLVDAVAPGLPDVEADGARLVQAVANLVENAIRHTPAGGRVTVAAGPAPEGPAAGVAFVVADTGGGIAAEDLPHLFDPRWHARRRARGAGSGLGLRIARGLARAHGGDLRAESAPGAGARFTLTVPAAAGAAAPDAPAAPAAPNTSPAAAPAA
jgi:signal transduction histidine kinase